MRKVILFIVVSMTTVHLCGQYNMPSLKDLESFVTSSGEYLMHIGDNREIEGSPYLTEEYLPGDVFIADHWYEGVDIRYDIYNAYFELKLESGVFVLDAMTKGADSVKYNGEIFVRKNLDPGKKLRVSFLSFLGEENGYSLYKEYRIRVKQGTQSDGYSEAKPAEFKSDGPDFYLYKNDEMWKISGSKSIVEIFNTDAKSVKSYLRKNKYKISDEDDLMEIIKHYSGI